MAISVGDRLGRFEILGSLGAGGMGEVYRARDHQLQRDVAIKVLPSALSGNADRRRRFEHEARAAGGLNHPNILAVYDIGLEGESSYIVTELLQGETLQDRMAGRPLPVRKALQYARQIASGLAAAHERGVVHRDIKPGNLFVTTDGHVKILDFGLAKLVAPDSSAHTDTVSLDGTQRTVMGTVAYMSPEVARGLRVDHRTDIFSFGVLLYEMLAGFAPFQRVTPGDTLNAILHDEPEDLPNNHPAIPALQRIIRHCLEKKPDERFQNCRDLLFQLESVPHDTEGVGPVLTVAGSRRIVQVAGGMLAIAGAVALAMVIAPRLQQRQTDAPHAVFRMTSFVGLEEFASISPDRKMVAFTATQGGWRQVFIQYLSGGPPLQVTKENSDHESPRWLADGSGLLYFSPAATGEVQGSLYKTATLGGSPQRLLDSIGGGDVGKSGRVACFRLENGRIQLISATLEGSDIKIITTLETRHYRYPRWSPDGQRIAFQGGDGFRWNIYVVEVRDGAKVVALTNDNRFVAGLSWLPDGTGIVYASSRGATLAYLPPLALWQVGLHGDAPPRQLTPSEASYQQPDVHESGLVSVARVQMRFDLWRYPFATGAAEAAIPSGEQLTHQTGQVMTPTVSPTGSEIAYLSDSGGHANIWVTTPDGRPRQITYESDPSVNIGVPIWSPDGRWIAFVSSRGNVANVFGIWLVRPDGSDLRQLVPKGLGVTWTPDSSAILYVDSPHTALRRINLGGGEPKTVRPDPVRNVIGAHGSTVYYLVERALMDGRPEFEIRAAPIGEGPARVVKTIDASRVASWEVPFNPALSPDGRWLAMALSDGFTSNIWALSTEDGRWQQVTNFGDRAVFIARRVSWSSDGRSVVAAIGEGDSDIFLLDGLIPGLAR